jgi:hypothetical protein
MEQLQLKRGTAARWIELNSVLAAGEPGFEYDTKRLKIGDGITPWKELPYIGSNKIYSVNTYKDLPSIGDETCLYKVEDEKSLYQWNTTDQKYEVLGGNSSFDPSKINLINGGNANVGN